MLLLIEGFTHIQGSYMPDYLRYKWNPKNTFGGVAGGNMVVSSDSTNRRTGVGYCGSLSYGSAYLQPHLEHLTTTNTLILGYAFRIYAYPTVAPSDGTVYLVIGRFTEKPAGSEIHHVDVRLQADHSITIHRYNGTTWDLLHTSAVQTFAHGTWYYLEIKCTVSNSGSVVVRKDGVTIVNYSGDTNNNGTTQIIGQTTFGLHSNVNIGLYNVCDMYIADTTGSTNNDFLGDVRVDTLTVTGNGATNDFTPSAGSNYQNVDDATLPDGDTTYNEGTTVGDREEYALSDISHNPTTIYGVQAVATMIRKDGVAREVQLQIDGTDVGDPAVLTDWYVPFTAISESGWDQTAVNAMVAGIEITV